jgi:hypothetical protein
MHKEHIAAVSYEAPTIYIRKLAFPVSHFAFFKLVYISVLFGTAVPFYSW